MTLHPKPSPQTLAKYFAKDGFTTADKIEPPPRPEFVADKLDLPAFSPEKKHAFTLLRPYGVYVLATDRPMQWSTHDADGAVFDRYGHNQLCWPVRIGDTASWDDTVTAMWNRNPAVGTGVKWRIWCRTLDERQSLLLHVGEWLARAAEAAGYRRMHAGFTDAGPNFKRLDFGKDIQILARRMGIFTWTDKSMSEFLDRALQGAKLNGVYIMDRRGRKILDCPAFERLADILTKQEMKKQGLWGVEG